MSGGDMRAEKRHGWGQYVRSFGFVVLGALLVFILWMFTRPLSADTIWIQYPIHQDDTRQSILLVRRNDDTLLSQSGPRQVVRRGAFDIDSLFQQLLGQLVNTWDEEKRVDEAIGVVRIWFSDDTSGTYLIYDKKFADEIFAWARDNLVDP